MARKGAKRAATTGALELEVVLEETQPRIWRTLVVSPKATLGDLHEILQVAMGWEGGHVHRFVQGDEAWTDPSHEIEDTSPETKVTLGELLRRKGDSLGYEYDLGDSWVHTVRVLEVLALADAGTLPRCVAGARACPPEDCGGPVGYEDLLAILADPKHEEHEDRKEWLGRRFDADAFDAGAITRELRRLDV